MWGSNGSNDMNKRDSGSGGNSAEPGSGTGAHNDNAPAGNKASGPTSGPTSGPRTGGTGGTGSNNQVGCNSMVLACGSSCCTA